MHGLSPDIGLLIQKDVELQCETIVISETTVRTLLNNYLSQTALLDCVL